MTKDEALKMALEALEKVTQAFLDTEGNHGQIEDEAWQAAYDAQEPLRQALDHLPDATKMIDTGIDRGAWSDVPDATKWVDELRGDEEPEQTVSLEEYKRLQRLVTSQGIRLMEYESKQEPVAWGCQYKSARLDVFKTKEVAEKYVSGSLRNGADVRLVELYTTPPKSEWVGLTNEERTEAANNAGFGHINIALEIEAKLKEKNT